MRKVLIGMGLALTVALMLPACASKSATTAEDEAGTTAADLPTLTVMAADYSLTAPAQVPAGPTRIEVMNHGAEPHQAALVRLEPGRTAGDYLAALAQSFDAAAPVGTWVAGPNGAAPGATTGVVADLEPGHYLVLCVIPSPDGTPHVVKGMMTELDVVADTDATTGGTGDAADDAPVVHLREFEFGVPDDFVAAVANGRPVTVVNDGEQAHEMVVSRLPDGVTIGDIVAWNDHPLFTPEPFPQPQVDVAGTTVIAPGASAEVQLDLPAGDYALVCFIPDPASGESHLHEGMAYPFTIG
jgi:hypothetical protein